MVIQNVLGMVQCRKGLYETHTSEYCAVTTNDQVSIQSMKNDFDSEVYNPWGAASEPVLIWEVETGKYLTTVEAEEIRLEPAPGSAQPSINAKPVHLRELTKDENGMVKPEFLWELYDMQL